jgi:hypothetical protein
MSKKNRKSVSRMAKRAVQQARKQTEREIVANEAHLDQVFATLEGLLLKNKNEDDHRDFRLTVEKLRRSDCQATYHRLVDTMAHALDVIDRSKTLRQMLALVDEGKES